MKISIDMDVLNAERHALYKARAECFRQAKERATAMEGHPGAGKPENAVRDRKDYLFIESQKIEAENNGDKLTAKMKKIEEFQGCIKDAIETGTVGVYIEDGQVVEMKEPAEAAAS